MTAIQAERAVSEPDGITLRGATLRALGRIDAMPKDMRRLVHEIGWEPVAMMQTCKLTVGQMRMVYHACQSSPTPGTQGVRGGDTGAHQPSAVLGHLDVLLSRVGVEMTATALLAFFKRHGMVLLPIEPNSVMVEASMATVSSFDVTCTKAEKHRRRLRAAIHAAAARLWPTVFGAAP